MPSCRHCGNETGEGAEFCPKCGGRLAGFTEEETQRYINDLQGSIKKKEDAERKKRLREEQARTKARNQEVEARRQEAEQWLKKRPWVPWLVGILIVVVIVAVLWSGLDGIFPGSAKAPQIPQDEAIAISAGQLYQEYRNNEVAADLRYKGRLLKVTGIVDRVGEDILGYPYIKIVDKEGDWGGVICTYPKTESSRWLLARHNRGDTVTVTGICKGYLVNVLLERGQ